MTMPDFQIAQGALGSHSSTGLFSC